MKILMPMTVCIALIAPTLSSAATYVNGSAGIGVAANYWSGSSSRNWHGGGVDYVLAGWKSEASAKAAAESKAPVQAEQAETNPAPGDY